VVAGAFIARVRFRNKDEAEVDFLPFTRPDVDEATIADVASVLRSGWLATGPKVRELEQQLSAYCGGRPTRVLTSATAGLEIALHMIGIKPGDEVITPAMSFAATANVIARVGARPVFVDVDLDTRNMDVAAAARAVTPRTRALMPVHFAGHPIDMDATYALAKQHSLRVIEDAAHAIGSGSNGQRIGAIGDIVVFSFHPNKNITTIEGGGVIADNAAELRVLDLHKFHGLERHADGGAEVFLPGGKANLSDVAAAVGLGQLRRLEAFNARRRELAARYFKLMNSNLPSGCPLVRMPARGPGHNGNPGHVSDHSWHIFAPLLPLGELRIGRGDFIRLMHERGLGVGVHYPSIHLFDYYRKLGHGDGDFPNTERIGRETVSLPMFPAMRDSDVDRVCEAVAAICQENRR
jgi:dTDP-4-amino-4,6-dideoxygalactose transaminase